MNAEANAAMAEIERRLEAPTARLHERPRIITQPGEPAIPASPARNLPALLAELQATIDAVSIDLGLLAGRLSRIEAFLGIEP